jgi:hypothetical protein
VIGKTGEGGEEKANNISDARTQHKESKKCEKIVKSKQKNRQ